MKTNRNFNLIYVFLPLLYIVVGCYKSEDNPLFKVGSSGDAYRVTFKFLSDNADSSKIYDKLYTIVKEYKHDSKISENISTMGVKRTGFNLKGWESRSSTSSLINLNNTYAANKDVTLFAVWEYSDASQSTIDNLVNGGKLEAADVAKGRTLFGDATNGRCGCCHNRAGMFPSNSTMNDYVKSNKSSFISMAKQGHNNEFNIQDLIHVEAYINSL